MITATTEVKSENLSINESNRLVELERKIEHGITTFIEVGEALMEIRDSRLYRGEYGTFQDYCRKEWKMSRPRVYQLIGAAEVAPRLSTMVDKPPTSERQARSLTKLESEQQPVAWNRAVEIADGKPPTARQVEQAVIELVPNRDDKSPQEVVAIERKRRRKRELIRRPYRELEDAWWRAIPAQRKCLLKAILREPIHRKWVCEELSKSDEKDTTPDAIGPAGVDPIAHIFAELWKEVLLCNKTLIVNWIRTFLVNEDGELDGDHAKILLRSCPRYNDSPLTATGGPLRR